MVKLTSRGYIRVYMPEHRLAGKKNGLVMLHRVIYENFHKCCLLPWAVIHHINGIKNDNRPKNLQGMANNKHAIIEGKRYVSGICHWLAEQLDKSKLSASSRIQSSADEVENDKQDQYLRTNVIDVFAKKQNLFVTIFDVTTSFQNMVLKYVNVNVSIHVTALLEHTFYYINN